MDLNFKLCPSPLACVFVARENKKNLQVQWVFLSTLQLNLKSENQTNQTNPEGIIRKQACKTGLMG